MWPTRPRCGRRQLLFDGAGITLFINEEGRVGARVGDTEVLAAEPLRAQRWVRVAGSARAGELALAVADTVTSTSGSAGPGAGDDPPGRRLRRQAARPRSPSIVHSPITSCRTSNSAPDRSWDIRQARLLNAPTLAVTGRLWDDDTTDFRVAPDEYAAVYFHTDDLDDAGWEPTCSLTVPEDLVSGVYAFGLTAGSLTDHVPFVVRPRAGTSSGDIGLLLPTLTYQVYGNERLLDGGETGMAPIPQGEVTLDPADRWLSKHPEAGSSCYDHHADGDGVSLVSLRRPIPNLRPSFVWWITNSPERFGSDLYLVDWLEQRGEPFDVFTDHDLHAAGGGIARAISSDLDRDASRVLHRVDARRGTRLPRGRRAADVPRRQRFLLGDQHRPQPPPHRRGQARREWHPSVVVAAGRAAARNHRGAGWTVAVSGP